MKRSTITASSPKLRRASLRASASAAAKSSGASTRRIPRPPPPAAALISTGKPMARCGVGKLCVALGAVVARDHRNAGFDGETAGSDLRPHLLDDVGMGTHPDQSRSHDGSGEAGVLGQEAVAGMDGVSAAGRRRVEQPIDRQVRLGERRRSESVRHRRLGDVGCVGIGIGEHGHGLVSETMGGGHDPPGDLAPVGDEDAHASAHIRYTMPGPGDGAGRRAASARHRPSTSRVSVGAIRPSSHRRDVA